MCANAYRLARLPEASAAFALDAGEDGAANVAVTSTAGLPALTGTLESSFQDGAYAVQTLKAGTVLYRAENVGQGIGRFFAATKPASAADAEKLYNLAKWRNGSEVVTTYRLTSDTTMYVGRVAGGEGDQVLVPTDLQPQDLFEFVDQERLS
ncbi:MAG: hypothetical protein QOD07_3113 [Frankiaceae bacterium]|jgi:hypothetical protein|nr:hypothetical protein [Frankiaceae bacterium]